MEFCPAILAQTESEFKEKVERVRSLGLPLHVDVMDGIFVPQKTWANPVEVMNIADELPVEAHLMVSDPEHSAIVWLAAGAKRVWIHAESTNRELMIIRASPNQVHRLGMVLNPETPISRVTSIIDQISAVMIMGVTPGSSGQEFQEIALEKARELKELRPNLWVKIDGGVNVDNIAKIAEAGVDAVASASSITNYPDPTAGLVMMKQRILGESAPLPSPLKGGDAQEETPIEEPPPESVNVYNIPTESAEPTPEPEAPLPSPLKGGDPQEEASTEETQQVEEPVIQESPVISESKELESPDFSAAALSLSDEPEEEKEKPPEPPKDPGEQPV